MAQWYEAFIFFVKQQKQTQAMTEFEKFSPISEENQHDELFVCDVQDYSYESVKFERQSYFQKSKHGFRSEFIGTGRVTQERKFEEKVLDRGTTMLSYSSDEGSDGESGQDIVRVPGGVYTEGHGIVENNEYAEGRELGDDDDIQEQKKDVQVQQPVPKKPEPKAKPKKKIDWWDKLWM